MLLCNLSKLVFTVNFFSNVEEGELTHSIVIKWNDFCAIWNKLNSFTNCTRCACVILWTRSIYSKLHSKSFNFVLELYFWAAFIDKYVGLSLIKILFTMLKMETYLLYSFLISIFWVTRGLVISKFWEKAENDFLGPQNGLQIEKWKIHLLKPRIRFRINWSILWSLQNHFSGCLVTFPLSNQVQQNFNLRNC